MTGKDTVALEMMTVGMVQWPGKVGMMLVVRMTQWDIQWDTVKLGTEEADLLPGEDVQRHTQLQHKQYTWHKCITWRYRTNVNVSRSQVQRHVHSTLDVERCPTTFHTSRKLLSRV